MVLFNRKTYAEFIYAPGTLGKRTSAIEVRDRDISKIKVPSNATAFMFFDIVSTTIEVDGKPVELCSDRIKKSLMHYHDGRVYTYEEVQREVPDNRMLLRNIKTNRWDKVIETKDGVFLPFSDESDILIETEQHNQD